MDRHERMLQGNSRYLSLPNSCFRGKHTKHLGKVATSYRRTPYHCVKSTKRAHPRIANFATTRYRALSAPSVYWVLFEQYAMGIPILVPTPEFLWKLHDKYDCSQRTLGMLRSGERPSRSKHLGLIKQADPNNDLDEASFLHWITFSDFYTWPHIVQFGSWSELQNMLAGETIVWGEVSRNMKDYTRHQISSLRLRWRRK